MILEQTSRQRGYLLIIKSFQAPVNRPITATYRLTAFPGNLQKLYKLRDHMKNQDSLSAAAEGYLAIMYGCYPDAGPFGAETGWSGAQDTSQGSNPGQAERERACLLVQLINPLTHFRSSSQLKSQQFFLVLLSLMRLSPG